MRRLPWTLIFAGFTLVALGCGRSEPTPSAQSTPDPDNPIIAGVPLRSLLIELKGPDPERRRSAAMSLGKAPAIHAVTPLIEALKDQDAKVRKAAARSLGVIGPEAKAAMVPLISALRDSNDEVKAAAAAAVREFGRDAKDAVPALTEMYKSTNNDLRAQAALALKRIDPDAARAAGVPEP
jgi:HEAT repeat protein